MLYNFHALLEGDLLEESHKRLVKIGLRRAARRIQMPYRPSDLVAALRLELRRKVLTLQVASSNRPADSLHLTAIRGWPDIHDMLSQYYKAEKPDKRLSGMLERPLSTDKFYEEAARILTSKINSEVPVTIGGPHNIFYLTSTERLDVASSAFRRLPYADRAKRVRDVLGLGHIAADEHGNPSPLFAFQSLVPASRLKLGARIARPTAIDGFDNNRFKQAWPASELDPRGGGLTVRLSMPFSAGSSEFVATKMLLKGQFRCEYIGSVAEPAVGTDADYVRYLDFCHGPILQDIPARIENWRPR